MIDNEEARREFEGLDARESQAALADELSEELAAAASEDEPSADEPEPQADDVDAPEEDAEAASDDPVWSAAQDAEHSRMIEALLFAASEPLDEATIAKRLPHGVDVPALLETLARHYENRGVHLSQVSGKWRFATNPDVAHVLETEKIEPRKLSRAALETLAIIAYHQPCTRADIEDVRGVAVSKGSLDQLLEVGWVRLRGRRRDAPGRPVLYGTTSGFLEHFGLESVGDLPGVADLKAAGLLDARLPPGFTVPTPVDGGGDELIDEDAEAEFAQDFMAEEAEASTLDEDHSEAAYDS